MSGKITVFNMSGIFKALKNMPLKKAKGDAVVFGNFRGEEALLLKHLMKCLEKVIEQHIQKAADIADMQFGFIPGKGIIDAIFIAWQL